MPGQRGRGSRALRGSDGGGTQHGRPGGGAGGGNFRHRPAGVHGTKLHLPGGRSLVSLMYWSWSYIRRGSEGRGGEIIGRSGWGRWYLMLFGEILKPDFEGSRQYPDFFLSFFLKNLRSTKLLLRKETGSEN